MLLKAVRLKVLHSTGRRTGAAVPLPCGTAGGEGAGAEGRQAGGAEVAVERLVAQRCWDADAARAGRCALREERRGAAPRPAVLFAGGQPAQVDGAEGAAEEVDLAGPGRLQRRRRQGALPTLSLCLCAPCLLSTRVLRLGPAGAARRTAWLRGGDAVCRSRPQISAATGTKDMCMGRHGKGGPRYSFGTASRDDDGSKVYLGSGHNKASSMFGHQSPGPATYNTRTTDTAPGFKFTKDTDR